MLKQTITMPSAWNIREMAKQFKDCCENLAALKENGGCYYWKFANREAKNIAVVLGWSAYGKQNEADVDKYTDGEYQLAVKVAYQPDNSIMQCDYEIDWQQVYDKNTGEILDSEEFLYEDTDFERVAESIKSSAEYIIKWGVNVQ